MNKTFDIYEINYKISQSMTKDEKAIFRKVPTSKFEYPKKARYTVPLFTCKLTDDEFNHLSWEEFKKLAENVMKKSIIDFSQYETFPKMSRAWNLCSGISTNKRQNSIEFRWDIDYYCAFMDGCPLILD